MKNMLLTIATGTLLLLMTGCSGSETLKAAGGWIKDTATSAGLAVQVKVRDKNLINIDLGKED